MGCNVSAVLPVRLLSEVIMVLMMRTSNLFTLNEEVFMNARSMSYRRQTSAAAAVEVDITCLKTELCVRYTTLRLASEECSIQSLDPVSKVYVYAV